MIKHLKLQKAVCAIILGVLALVVAQLMSSNKVTGASYVLGLSGFLLIIGACMFLYPILFAKKDEVNENVVHLTPVAKDENVRVDTEEL